MVQGQRSLKVTETSRDVSFCAHAILKPNEVLYVPDATQDPRFADNPLVVGDFGLRFYAGMPIIGPGGQALGALCVIDREPRNVSEGTLDQLKQLAVGVWSALRLHATVHALQRLSVTDSLTGLENRAGFDKRLSNGSPAIASATSTPPAPNASMPRDPAAGV